MSRLRVHCFSVSLDGYSAGPNQDLSNPVGAGGPLSSDGLLRKSHKKVNTRVPVCPQAL
jgi:hypothetical protein